MLENKQEKFLKKVIGAEVKPYMKGYDYLQEVQSLTSKYKSTLENLRAELYKTLLLDLFAGNIENTENSIKRNEAIEQIELILPHLENLSEKTSQKRVKEIFKEAICEILPRKSCQIVELISQGKTKEEIAAALHYAKGSLNKEVQRIGDKLSNTLKGKKTYSEILAELDLITLTNKNTINNVFKSLQFLLC